MRAKHENMILFLTSSPSLWMDGALNPANGFIDEMRRVVPPWARALFVTSSPDDVGFSEHCLVSMRKAFEDEGFTFSRFNLLDRRTAHVAADLVHDSDLVILGGGHVPTQNRFFHEIYLRPILQAYNGVVMGISAGSMNCADKVYALPEMEGEATDPYYRRFMPGLRLTRSQIIPHYHTIRHARVDGRLMIQDLALYDSYGKRFYLLPDGSYIYSENKTEELRGEAYLIENGVIRKVSEDGQRVMLFNDFFL